MLCQGVAKLCNCLCDPGGAVFEIFSPRATSFHAGFVQNTTSIPRASVSFSRLQPLVADACRLTPVVGLRFDSHNAVPPGRHDTECQST